MRDFKYKKATFKSLDKFQNAEYEEFKFRADGSPEILDKVNYSLSDYLALMQHYSVPTNLLDWSEDAMTALYFALEDLMNSHTQLPTKNKSAILYIFNPIQYNCIRNKIIERVALENTDRSILFQDIMKTTISTSGTIPNLSISYNEKLYNMFLMGDNKYGQDYCNYKNEIKSLHEKNVVAYLPLAIYTSRLNPRIRSQSGMFLSYNLYTPPSEGYDYNYMNLENIQDYYLSEFKKENPIPFLYKFIIESNVKEEFKDWLSSIGVSKEKIYPELCNIGQRVKDKTN